jgi:hypothetical protein
MCNITDNLIINMFEEKVYKTRKNIHMHVKIYTKDLI